MKLIPREWEEYPTLTGLRRQMNRLFEYFPTGEEPGFEWWPAVNVAETPETVVVTAELPGLEPKEIEISVVGDTLTIRGEKRIEREEKGKTWYRREIAGGKFTRSFTLPASVDAEHVDATSKAGILTITLPKRAEAKARKIEVKVK
ncbi:MAG: Hsp20/alpha crystallin family protein [Planctomycetes bacterium]|nr:Hsp20/alpha crystallin family protein [Planctomycetota bacterium]